MSGPTVEQLQRSRFPGLPLDCGKAADPGIMDDAEWRDWTERPTTPDQRRIEAYLDRFDLTGRRILHVGLGNSSLARRFSIRAKEIVGTTVVTQEADFGALLGLPNYVALVHNKYLPDGAPEGPFDFIVDNNPTTFGCCLKHMEAMLRYYAGNLAPGGQVVTDRVGLGWVSAGEGQLARWAFDFADLAAVAPLAGLQAYRFDRNLYLLAKERPRRPPRLSWRARLGRLLRR